VNKMNWKLPAIAAMVCMIALPATAQEEVGGKQAGDIVLGFSVLGVLPQSGGRVDTIGGKPDPSNTVTPQLDVTWFATPNLSLNLIAATTRHDVTVRGSALGMSIWAGCGCCRRP
jgi:outer membrane protein